MRLLQFDGHGTFSLSEYTGDDIPSYAILSHTWGADGEEVTFEDLGNDTHRIKAGYNKLIFCAKQAAADGLKYIWVDTCCIKKSDPVELQYAINSMFRWYQNAERCYVYLSDVHSTKDNEMRDASWVASFRASRWFTRGWTLQELLAPESVEFFAKEHIRIGDKKSLEEIIHDITRIPIKALQGSPLSDFTVNERMSWVENRKAKYEEDKIYSLQGIFNINIPLIYGEGWKKASIRIQREIQQSLDSTSSSSKVRAPWMVPFSRNPNFTGRKSQLAYLEEQLFVRGQPTKYAITGLGGVGKTQVVLELVHRIREKYKSCLIIWIPATNIESLHQAYLDAAKQLSILGWDDEKADVRKLVQDYLSDDSAGQWLLVFDNADDIDMWITKSGSEAGSSRLIDYLPRSEQGRIVFTSRNRKTAVKLAHHNIVEIPEMNEDVATQLLRKSLINPDLVNSESDTKALLEELTYLPLAIIQAVAYINENGIAFAEYRSLLAAQEEDVIDLLSEEFEDDRRYHNIKNPVALTWLISFEQIRHRDPLAADYLSLMACIDPKDIPQSLLPAGTSRKKKIEAVGTLEAYSFIIKRPADLALDLHRLVHLATRNWLRKEKLVAQWTERAITRLEEVFPENDHRNRSIWKMFLPHARYILESTFVDRSKKTRMDLMWKFGLCLYDDGRFNEAELLFRQTLQLREKVLGQEHPDTLTSMNNLALLLQSQGKYDEAEPMYRQTLQLTEKVLGHEHPSTLTSMNNLAGLLKSQGKYDEAEPIYRQTLQLREKVLGHEHPDTLTSMNNLALLLQSQGKYDEAEPIYLQTLQLTEKVLGHEHPSTLTSMNNLALLLQSQGKYDEAEPIYRKTLQLTEKVLGHEHPDTLTSMNNLAVLLKSQGKYDEAEPIYRQTLQLTEKVLGHEHPSTLTSMNNLALLLQSQGKYDEAEPIYLQTLQLTEKVLGHEHPSTLTSMNNLAVLLESQGKYDEAEPIYRKTLQLRDKVLGKEHPDTLTSIYCLAICCQTQRQYTEALELYDRACYGYWRSLGLDHPTTLACINHRLSMQKEKESEGDFTT